jgi:hypothetical protein
MKAPTVKILEAAKDRYVTTKNGQKQVWSQKAQLETEKMRILIDVDVDGPTAAYDVGQVYEWDLTEDLVPGRFGPELARRMTLIPVGKAQAKAA